jgi:hypothetical protein
MNEPGEKIIQAFHHCNICPWDEVGVLLSFTEKFTHYPPPTTHIDIEFSS